MSDGSDVLRNRRLALAGAFADVVSIVTPEAAATFADALREVLALEELLKREAALDAALAEAGVSREERPLTAEDKELLAERQADEDALQAAAEAKRAAEEEALRLEEEARAEEAARQAKADAEAAAEVEARRAEEAARRAEEAAAALEGAAPVTRACRTTASSSTASATPTTSRVSLRTGRDGSASTCTRIGCRMATARRRATRTSCRSGSTA